MHNSLLSQAVVWSDCVGEPPPGLAGRPVRSDGRPGRPAPASVKEGIGRGAGKTTPAEGSPYSEGSDEHRLRENRRDAATADCVPTHTFFRKAV
jgi:hypothetical protein